MIDIDEFLIRVYDSQERRVNGSFLYKLKDEEGLILTEEYIFIKNISSYILEGWGHYDESFAEGYEVFPIFTDLRQKKFLKERSDINNEKTKLKIQYNS